MKELSVVEMNEVSGAGWNLWTGAGVGFITGIVALALHGGAINTPVDFRGKDAGLVIDSATMLGGLAGAIAEYHSK